MIIIIKMEAFNRPLKIKTCLTSFQQYCQQNNRCQTQMDKLRQCFNTTITRYTKKPTPVPKKQEIQHQSVSSSRKFITTHHKKSKNIMLPCFNPELMEITKLKLHANQKEPTRFKTQYTVHRTNIKRYLKLKKNTEFNTSRHSAINRSQQRQTSNKFYQAPQYRYQTQHNEQKNKKDLEQIDVNLDFKYKRSKTNPNQSNFDFQSFLEEKSVRKSQRQRKGRVIFSSKEHIALNRVKKNETSHSGMKTGMKPKQNLTGWETHYLEDDFNISGPATPSDTLKHK